MLIFERRRMLAAIAVLGLVAGGWSELSVASVATPASQAVAAGSPEAAIQDVDTALIDAMKAGSKAGYAGRYRILEPVLSKTFDFQRIARLTLGSNWAKLNASQQQQFVKVLRQYTIATYAGRFDSYAGEHLAIVQTEKLQSGTVGVFTTFTERSGQVHRFDYLMQKSGKDWQVINVVADGVSDLSLKRAEYGETLNKNGFPALIAHLQHQIQGYEAGKS